MRIPHERLPARTPVAPDSSSERREEDGRTSSASSPNVAFDPGYVALLGAVGVSNTVERFSRSAA